MPTANGEKDRKVMFSQGERTFVNSRHSWRNTNQSAAKRAVWAAVHEADHEADQQLAGRRFTRRIRQLKRAVHEVDHSVPGGSIGRLEATR